MHEWERVDRAAEKTIGDSQLGIRKMAEETNLEIRKVSVQENTLYVPSIAT